MKLHTRREPSADNHSAKVRSADIDRNVGRTHPGKQRPNMTVVGLLVAVVVQVAGLFALVVARPPSSVSTVEAAEPVVVPVGSAEQAGRHEARLTLEWDEQPTIASSGGEGVVTAVSIDDGDEVAGGTMVAEVSDVGVLAYEADAPLHRILGPGDSGPDVPRLEGLLVQAGELNEAVGATTVDARMSEAIRRLGERTGGLHERKGSGDDGEDVGYELWPSEFVWIGDSPVVGATTHFGVGERWPALGESVLSQPSVLTSAQVSESQGEGEARGESVGEVDENGETVDAGSAESVDENGETVDAGSAESVDEGDETVGGGGAMSDPLQLEPVEGGYVFEAEGERLPLADDGTKLSDDGLATLDEGVPAGTELIEGHVALAEPVGVPSVPSTAVVTDRAAATCVFVPEERNDGSGFEPVVVEIVDSGFSESYLAESPGKELLVNPLAVMDEPQCG